MQEIPWLIPKDTWQAWYVGRGLSFYEVHTSYDMAWAVASWKEIEWGQKECEYIRTIDGLRAEITTLNSTITSITEL